MQEDRKEEEETEERHDHLCLPQSLHHQNPHNPPIASSSASTCGLVLTWFHLLYHNLGGFLDASEQLHIYVFAVLSSIRMPSLYHLL